MPQTPREKYFEMGMVLSDIAHDMTLNGFPIDPAARERHRIRLTRERDEAEIEFIDLTGFEKVKKGKDKWVSPCRQNGVLHKLFYETFGVEPRKEYYSRDTGELMVNGNMLQDVADEAEDPHQRKVASALLKFRKAAKYLESFIENLPVLEDGRIHVPWNIFGARTMRWTAPILHQLPKTQAVTLPDGSKKVTRQGLRDICCAPEGWTIIESDKSQLELRWITLLTGDPPLVEAYRKGVDVHSQNAMDLMGQPKGMAREVAKTFVFTDIYGGDPHTAWKQMTPRFPGLQKRLIENCSKKWKAAHPVIERYKETQFALAREKGYIECPLSGLRIEYHPVGGRFRVDRTKLINTRVQHSGSDVINPETVRVARNLKNGAWLAAMIHDADVVICRDEDVEETAEMMLREMDTTVEYEGRSMRFISEVKTGKNLGDMKDWKKAA